MVSFSVACSVEGSQLAQPQISDTIVERTTLREHQKWAKTAQCETTECSRQDMRRMVLAAPLPIAAFGLNIGNSTKHWFPQNFKLQGSCLSYHEAILDTLSHSRSPHQVTEPISTLRFETISHTKVMHAKHLTSPVFEKG